MVVPVAAVRRVAVTVVDEVHVIAVRDRYMPAALTVSVIVTCVLVVPVGLALVSVPIVVTMQVTVVYVVDMPCVRDRDVSTALAVRVIVTGVRPVLYRCRHATHLQSRGPARLRTQPTGCPRLVPSRTRMTKKTRAANSPLFGDEFDNDFQRESG